MEHKLRDEGSDIKACSEEWASPKRPLNLGRLPQTQLFECTPTQRQENMLDGVFESLVGPLCEY